MGLRWIYSVTLAVLVLNAGALLWPPRPAFSDMEWCYQDPTLVIEGRTVHFNVGVPRAHLTSVTGSTLTVVVPTNVQARLSGTNAAYFPITVQLEREGVWTGTGDIPVRAYATVYAPAGVPTRFVAQQSGTSTVAAMHGTANVPMALTYSVK